MATESDYTFEDGLNKDTFSQICSYLKLEDQLLLGCASKDLYLKVEDYLECARQTFFSNNRSSSNGSSNSICFHKLVKYLFDSLSPSHPMKLNVKFLLMQLSSLLDESRSKANNNETNTSSNAENRYYTKNSGLCGHYFRLSRRYVNKSLFDFIELERLRSKICSSATCLVEGLEYGDSISLDRYIGDVLCVVCLMSLNFGITSGDNELEWIECVCDGVKYNGIRTRKSPGDSLSLTARWYNLWVLLHSFIIKGMVATLPVDFFKKQSLQLGKILDPHILPLLSPLSKETCVLLIKTVGTLWDVTPAYIPRFKVNDFGPLGPAFRGRDRPRSIYINVQESLISLNGFAMSIIQNSKYVADEEEIASTEILSRLRWITRVHTEMFRIRPMTVAPPRVIFERSNSLDVATNNPNTAMIHLVAQ